jgi:hypothetical protein
MSVSDQARIAPHNSLHRIAAASGVLVGVFLLLGGYGHLVGVREALEAAIETPGESAFTLVLPGLLLIGTGLVDLGICRALWWGARWPVTLGLIANVIATLYVAFLLAEGLPNHPVGFFLALLSSHVVLLGAIRAGLVWPAQNARVQ